MPIKPENRNRYPADWRLQMAIVCAAGVCFGAGMLVGVLMGAAKC